uniref:Forkhead box protein N3 n=1 Tax=Lygus hesperus TaxID=30085 RepID=A0A146LAT2_LYGHE
MAPERGQRIIDETGVAPSQEATRSPHTILHLKEGDGALEGAAIGRGEDDDLTSLSWLQDKNLLKGINLRTNGGVNGAAMTSMKQESPTSDYAEDCPSELGESTCSSIASSSPVPPLGPVAHSTPVTSSAKNKHPHHIPYDPKIHVTSKPPYSFSCLIFMSIEDSKGKALPVKEIYSWILDHFPYYRNAPTGWKNSVRHNLSLNKCFRKVDKAPNLGKGSLWMVDPVSRPKLVEALMKAPYHPYTNLDKNNSAPHLRRSPSPIPAAEPPSTEEELDDVDAAAAMLVLKHGPHARLHISHTRDEYHKRHRMSLQQSPQSNGMIRVKREKLDIFGSESIVQDCDMLDVGEEIIIPQQEDESMPLITQPEDHTYSTMESGIEHSADEAFADGSDSNSSCSLRIYEDPDMEEQRKTAEGADALLNLAGIKTSRSTWESAPPPIKRIRTLSPTLPTKQPICLTPPSKLRRKPACPQRIKTKR